MADVTPAGITAGDANDESVVHASDADVGDLSRSHKERDISRLQSAFLTYDATKTYNVGDETAIGGNNVGPYIQINGNKAKQHDFIKQLPELFYGLYDNIANFGRYEVYSSKDKKGEYMLRTQDNTYSIVFGGKMSMGQSSRYDKKAQKATGMVISEDNKKVSTIHEFFNEFPEVLTVEEMFVPDGNREGFEIYK